MCDYAYDLVFIGKRIGGLLSLSRNHSNPLVPIATLVVDLDETLVHCSVQRPDRFDFSCSFTYSDQTHHVCGV
jgi:TFIIF-interacting CTD phosphatase-like protein